MRERRRIRQWSISWRFRGGRTRIEELQVKEKWRQKSRREGRRKIHDWKGDRKMLKKRDEIKTFLLCHLHLFTVHKSITQHYTDSALSTWVWKQYLSVCLSLSLKTHVEHKYPNVYIVRPTNTILNGCSFWQYLSPDLCYVPKNSHRTQNFCYSFGFPDIY